MEISDELKNFINENMRLIDENTKESWEEIYGRLRSLPRPQQLTGEFTQIILDAGINDPISILGYIPSYYLYGSNITNYKIPSYVTSIGDDAFSHCKSLTSIDIPDSVTSISSSAFYGCSRLTEIVIPDNVTSISTSAFQSCSSLTSVVIGDGVTSVGAQAFSYCYGLMSVEIPSSVTRIGGAMFYDCTKLTEIKFKGTKKQAIQLGLKKEEWRKNSAIKKIICIDGVIEL